MSSLDDDANVPLTPELPEVPKGVDRRAFLMRTAMIGAVAVLSGAPPASPEDAAKKAATATTPNGKVSLDLDVKKGTKGPVMTTLEEFYKVGPGPSSSHTIGPMRITYDFYQRCTKLPADQLAKATALRVHLFGSLSATGKGHRSARRSPASSARNRRRSTRRSSTSWPRSPTRPSR